MNEKKIKEIKAEIKEKEDKIERINGKKSMKIYFFFKFFLIYSKINYLSG